MILEVAVLNIRIGSEAAYEAAFREASPIISAMPGYVSHQLQRCIEVPNRYILLVNWESIEAHTVGFRGSPEYQSWKRLLHHFYDPFPTVEHYEFASVDPIRKDGIAPAGWHTVTSRIVAQNAKGLVDFVSFVFGAAGEYDSASPTIVEIGNSKVMISESGARGPKAAFLYVYVAEPDSTYRRALERGATSVEEPFDTPYGDRRCMIVDEWGNTWQIAAYAARNDAPGHRTPTPS